MKANLNDIPYKSYPEIPRKWGRINNYNHPSFKDKWYEDGFRDLIEDDFDQSTHKKGKIYWDQAEDVFKIELLKLTEEEINIQAEQQAQKVVDAVIGKYNDYKTDGINYYDSFRAKIVLDVNNNLISQEQGVSIGKILKPCFDWIITGDWLNALQELEEMIITSSSPIKANEYYQMAKNFVTNYIAENY